MTSPVIPWEAADGAPPLSRAQLKVAWTRARAEAGDAYAYWCRVPRDERRSAYAVFVAAADREAAAEAAFLRYVIDD